MKLKSLITAGALAAAAFVATAAPASADPPGRGYGGWNRNAPITLVTHRGAFTVDRSDRLFWRVTDAPYNFRPGLTYRYTDNCNRRGCDVLVFSRHSRRPIDRVFAPYLPSRHDWRVDRRDDNWRGDDRRWDDRGDRYDDDRRGDDRLEGGPRGGPRSDRPR